MTDTYDSHEVAQRYDKARSLPDATFDLWMNALRDLLSSKPVGTILDIGAGTGRFSIPLQNAFGCHVIAVDPSEAMLDQGRRGGFTEVTWRVGTAENIPLEDDSVDLIWMSQAYHHLEDIPAAFQEFRRVLVPSGHLAIRNATKENNPEYEFMKCFPEAAAIDGCKDAVPQRCSGFR